MRVIARTGSGYLVEATESELLAAAGLRVYEVGKLTHGDREIRIGLDINVKETHRWLSSLREQEEKCRSSAAFLRGMADMLDGVMPTTIVPPDDTAAKP